MTPLPVDYDITPIYYVDKFQEEIESYHQINHRDWARDMFVNDFIAGPEMKEYSRQLKKTNGPM